MADLTENTNFTQSNWLWFRISAETLDDLTIQVQAVWDTKQFIYMYAQYERTEAEGFHLQGYAVAKFRLRKKAVLEIFKLCPKYAFGPLPTNADKTRMAQYCSKEETRVPDTEAFERGEVPNGNAITEQKKKDAVKEILAEFRTGENSLKVKQWARDNNYTWGEISCAEAEFKNDKSLSKNLELMEMAEAVEWKPWQQYVVDYMKKPAHPREILVILDKRGNSGKTFLMKNIKCLDPDKVCNLSSGKTGDLMHIISKKPEVENIFINLPRSVHGIINYQAMEQAKDGEFCSTKYDGQEITILPTRLVIFTNEALNWDAMSHDRWKIMTIKGSSFKVQNHTEYIMMGGETASTENMTNKRPYVPDAEVEEAPKKKLATSSTPDLPSYKPSIGLNKDLFCPINCYMKPIKQHVCHVWTDNCDSNTKSDCTCTLMELITDNDF